jgi:hypothetical protein
MSELASEAVSTPASHCTVARPRVNAGTEMVDDMLELYIYIEHHRGSKLGRFTAYSD